MARLVLLHYEGKLFGGTLRTLGAFRLRSDLEVALFMIFLQCHDFSVASRCPNSGSTRSVCDQMGRDEACLRYPDRMSLRSLSQKKRKKRGQTIFPPRTHWAFP